MSTLIKPQSLHRQWIDLLLIQLSNWRWSWRGMLLSGMIIPLASICALWVFANSAGVEALRYVLVGNIVLSLMFENQGKVCNNFAFMKAVGTFSYFATLPIHRQLLVLATAFAFLLLSLPSLIVTAGVGSLLLKIPLHLSPWLIIAIPLVTLPMSGIGALIGAKTRTVEEAGILTLLVNFVSLGLGPVMFPPDRLPEILMYAGWLSPASYAASALRQVLLGPVTARLGLDLGILAISSIFIFWVVGRQMDWYTQ